MSYECKILADSISPHGVRLTTIQATFPRFILAEVNTHRMLSRNSASSRAIPPELLIARVVDDPFVPETFNKRVKGMGVGDALPEDEQEYGRSVWLDARDAAVKAARALVEGDVDKGRVNRLLEPFMFHTAIISATEWTNFFALRCHPDAQPEFRIIAEMMRDALEKNGPELLEEGYWHLPLVSSSERWEHGDLRPLASWEWWAMVSAGRCARVSFDTQDQYEEAQKSYDRAERLKTSGHLSPFEHIARPLTLDDDEMDPAPTGISPGSFFIGNYRGWVQMRKQIPNESNFAEVVEA